MPAGLGAAPSGAALPVALLPFENLTGDPALDWLTLGLMSLVGQALSREERLAPVPVSAVVSAMQAHDAPGEPQERAAAVRELTGARHVVRTRIFRGVSGLRLDYQVLGDDDESERTLHAGDPLALGRLLARDLLGRLVHGQASSLGREPAHDPWAMQVLARALESVATGHWQRAAQLLAVVIDIEPGHAQARLELARTRAMLHEAHGRFGAALDQWREVERAPQAALTRRLAQRANAHAAIAAAMCGVRDEATHRAENALADAHAAGSTDELCRAMALVCQVHTLWGQTLPRLPLAQAAVPERLAADARAAWWATRGHAHAQRRDHETACDCFATAVALYRSAGETEAERRLLLWWLHSLLQAGRLHEAEKVHQQAEAHSAGNGLLLRGLPWFRARLRHAKGDTGGALALLRVAIDGQIADLAQAVACALAARWLARARRPAEARQLLARIGPGFAQHPFARAAAQLCA
jgi:TolB-like protein